VAASSRAHRNIIGEGDTSLIEGIEILKAAQQAAGVQIKAILNDSDGLSVAFFPARAQHRDVKTNGLSYEDNYQGNAVAAVISPGRVEMRFHQEFSDDRVREMVKRIRMNPELALLRDCSFSYQGRAID
jgi:hypothetical protein